MNRNVSPFDTVAVIGAGLLGHAVAAVHAIGGCKVRLQDISDEQLRWAEKRVAQIISDMASYELLDPTSTESILSRCSFHRQLEDALAGADLVVEAIIENKEAKQALFKAMEPHISPTALIASNTSFLDIFPLVPDAIRQRSLIVHWYTPPYLIDLVDVVPPPGMDTVHAERMVGFLESIGKKPVLLKKFVPGYLANNIQMAIESEIFRLLDDGVADAQQIDDAIRYGLAHRLALLGQFGKIDYTGLQVVRDSHAAKIYRPPSLPTGTKKLDELLADNRSGVIAGGGFYDYSDYDSDTYLKERDRKIAALKGLINELDRSDEIQ